MAAALPSGPPAAEFGGLEVHPRGLLEQGAIDVGRAGEDSLATVVAWIVEDVEQGAEFRVGRGVWIADELLDEALDGVAAEHSEILGKEAPGQLEDESLDLFRRCAVAVADAVVQVGDRFGGFGREVAVELAEQGHDASAREEVEGLEVIGEIDEVEDGQGFPHVPAGLEDLESIEGAQDHVGRLITMR
ncbi:MAG: hypothetical protein Q7V58_03885 [Actinomycetota bacterium]|nr:hypothetical protein [Actinomycetota bacterium]